jgi:MFS family permease
VDTGFGSFALLVGQSITDRCLCVTPICPAKMPPKRTVGSSPHRQRPPAALVSSAGAAGSATGSSGRERYSAASWKLDEPLLPPPRRAALPLATRQRAFTSEEQLQQTPPRPATISGTRTPPFACADPTKASEQGAAPAEDLPLWWLIFVTLYYLPVILSWQLLGSIMLPAAVAEIVPMSDRNVKLGVAAAVGSAMQFAQPFVGAMSDHIAGCGPVLGRRRPFIIAGQLLSCAGCAILMKCRARGYWAAATGYTLYVLGNAIGYGVYPSLIANHIPEHQRGTASGLQGAMSLVGYLGAAGLGVIAGDANEAVLHSSGSDSSSGSDAAGGSLSPSGERTDELIYALLIALNFGCLVVAVISFGDRPSLCLTPEARTQDQPSLGPPAEPALHLTLSPVPPSPTCGNSAKRFFSAFRHRSFTVLFIAYVFASMGQFTSMTYCQYFFHDMIAPHFVVFGVSLTKDAEAAMGIWSFVQSLAAFLVVVPAGVLSEKVGRKLLLGVAFLITGCSFIPFALSGTKFEVLMLMSAIGGVGMGINQGVQMALFADVLPSAETAARDINLMVSSMTISQTVVSYAGGTLLSWLSSRHGCDIAQAYSIIWIGTAAVTCLGAPLLLCVGKTGSGGRQQQRSDGVDDMATDRLRALSAPDMQTQQPPQSVTVIGNNAELGSPGNWSGLLDVSSGADFEFEGEGQAPAMAATGVGDL